MISLTAGYNTYAEDIPSISPNAAFWTLGIYIIPSGSQKRQLEILHQAALDCGARLSTSTLTQEEAYWSYMTYLRPQLTYPLACSCLTPAQCYSIQSKALEHFLPKLHLNRHSPRAVLFGPRLYGGLELPYLYVDQGHQQLRLLVGHLNLQDELSLQIQILISNV
jgi:hypothetical protein